MRKLQTVDLFVKLTFALAIVFLYLFSIITGQVTMFLLMLAVVALVVFFVKVIITIMTSD
jgi:hypothetical protein